MSPNRALSNRDGLEQALRRLRSLAALSGLMMASFLGLPPAVAQESCSSCHAALVKAATIHAPTEDCTSCHESLATPHPQQGKRTFQLAQQVPELCLTCHAEIAETKHPHAPVSSGECLACHDPHQSERKALLLKEGDALCAGCHLDAQSFSKAATVHAALEAGCTSCHSPHGAANPKLLAESGSPLCFQCHDEMAAKVDKASVQHPPVKADKGCVSCHSPHASDNPKLLLKTQSETCLGCHKAVLPKTATLLHGPVKEGRCTACHDPHGGEHPKLLVKAFPKDPYVPYTDAAFGLCFSCHDRAMLQSESSVATGFRDGEKNLHYLHVNNKQKGRSCTLCHEIHGGPNPKLIAQSVAFGKWSLPLKFVKTGGGGSCAPGCHRPRSYDRDNPGRKLELRTPATKHN